METNIQESNFIDLTNRKKQLSAEEIEEMKEQGVTGDTIIQALVDNSSTFSEKSQFSKQKYINKKRKKYFMFVKLIRPNAFSICRAYFESKPSKICNLRTDSLAQLLSMGNVQSNSQVLVMESCIGIVVGSIAERINGAGRVINIYHGTQPSVKALDLFNFLSPIKDSVFHFPFNELSNLFNNNLLQNGNKKQIKQWIEEGADSLIIASKYDPSSVLFALLPFLSFARPFAVFCSYIQPLSICYEKLLKTGQAVNLDLSETWMREYQVLPARTHPLMRMNGASGYVLTGIKVCADNEDTSKITKKQKFN